MEKYMAGLIQLFGRDRFPVIVVILTVLLALALWLWAWAEKRREHRIRKIVEPSRNLIQQQQAQVTKSGHSISAAPAGRKQPGDWRYARLFHWQFDLWAFMVVVVAIFVAH